MADLSWLRNGSNKSNELIFHFLIIGKQHKIYGDLRREEIEEKIKKKRQTQSRGGSYDHSDWRGGSACTGELCR